MTDIEHDANDAARHGNREALERVTAERDALQAKLDLAMKALNSIAAEAYVTVDKPKKMYRGWRAIAVSRIDMARDATKKLEERPMTDGQFIEKATLENWDDRIKEQHYEIKRLTAERDALCNAGIAEIAARNPSVMDYMRHWEGRAETAEAERDALQEKLREEASIDIPSSSSLAFREGYRQGFLDGYAAYRGAMEETND